MFILNLPTFVQILESFIGTGCYICRLIQNILFRGLNKNNFASWSIQISPFYLSFLTVASKWNNKEKTILTDKRFVRTNESYIINSPNVNFVFRNSEHVYYNSSKHQPNNVRSVNLLSQFFVVPSPGFQLMLLRYRGNKSACFVSDKLDHPSIKALQ